MSQERRKHQCHIAGCDSQATHEPHVFLHYRNREGRTCAIEMKGTSLVCEKHRATYTQLLYNNTNKDLIADQLIKNNMPAPNFDSMTIEFRELQRERTVIELHSTRPAPAVEIIRCGREQIGEGQCTNPAQWQVVFKVWKYGTRKNDSHTRLLINLHLCNKCKKLTKPEDFSDDPDLRARMTAQLAKLGHPMVDWKMFDLEFIPIKDKSHSMVLQEFMEI